MCCHKERNKSAVKFLLSLLTEKKMNYGQYPSKTWMFGTRSMAQQYEGECNLLNKELVRSFLTPLVIFFPTSRSVQDTDLSSTRSLRRFLTDLINFLVN